MATDILNDALASAVRSVQSALPSQAPSVAVEGVRKTATGDRPVRGLIDCVIAADGYSDPLGEISSSSQLASISLIVSFGSWFDVTPPQDGDILTLPDGRKFTVTSVARVRGIFYRIGARQC